VGLVDAFGYPDWVLKAPIGAYDGDIYEKYLQTVKNAPNCVQTLPFWNQLIYPMTSSQL